MNKYEWFIPENKEGKPTDLHYSTVALSIEEAEASFSRAFHRMLNPPIWHSITGKASANFLLTDKDGKEVTRLMEQGDLIRIDIPGPGPRLGSGYDWVRVEKMTTSAIDRKNCLWAGVLLKPCPPPGTDVKEAAHFFKADASSTFIIEREQERIGISYYGRNEVPNIHTGKMVDDIRNAAVAFGAMAGLSEAQWSAFCKGLLTGEIGGRAPDLLSIS